MLVEIECCCGCKERFYHENKKKKFINGHRKGIKKSEEHKLNMRKSWSKERRNEKSISFTENNPRKLEGCTEKIKKTCEAKYGVDNVSKATVVKKKLSENNAMKNPVHLEKVKEYHNRPEIKILKSERLKDKTHKIHSKESIEKRNLTTAIRKSNGEIGQVKAIWTVGKFENKSKVLEWYDSSFELKRMVELNQSNCNWTKKHGIRIPYINSKGIKSYYVPDFLIIDESGNKVVEELKGWMDEGNVILKAEAAKKYCEENGMKYKFLLGKDFKLIKELSYGF